MPDAKTRPDFIIVGAAKAGSSTLRDYMAEHPEVHVPRKEVHFFNNDENYARGVEWYMSKILEGCDPTEAANLVVGEKTPAYCYQPNCRDRIKETTPDAKLIWILRDPVQRTYSNYLHARKDGGDIASLRKAIDREPERLKKNIFRGYVKRSKYVNQIKFYLEVFPPEQMYYVLFEDLVSKRDETLAKLADYLGIGPFPADMPRVHSNPTGMPLFPHLVWASRQAFGFGSLPNRIARKISYWKTKPKPPLDPVIRKELKSVFDPYNKELAALTGLDLSKWR